jgi:hypothetical protein
MHKRRSRYSRLFRKKLLAILRGDGFRIKVLASKPESSIYLKAQTLSWIKKLSSISEESGKKFQIDLNLITQKLIKNFTKRSNLKYIDIELKKPILNQSQLQTIQLFLNLIHLGVINVKNLLEDKYTQYKFSHSLDNVFREVSRIHLDDKHFSKYLKQIVKEHLATHQKTLEHIAYDGILTNLAIAIVLYSAIKKIMENQANQNNTVKNNVYIYIEPRIYRQLSTDHSKMLLSIGANPVELKKLSIIKSYKNKRFIEVIADLAIVVEHKKAHKKKKRYTIKALIEVKRYRNIDKLLEFLQVADLTKLSRENQHVLDSIAKNLLSLLLMDIVIDYIVLIYATDRITITKLISLEQRIYQFILECLAKKLNRSFTREEYIKSIFELSKRMLKVRVVPIENKKKDAVNITRVAEVINL